MSMKKYLGFGVLIVGLFLSGCGGSGDDIYFPDYDPGSYNPIPNPNPPRPNQLLAYYDSYDAVTDTELWVTSFYGVLSNDIYTTGETYVEFPTRTVQGGTIVGYSDGSFEYDPPYGFYGADSFSYTLSDITGRTSSANVYLNVYSE